ncbi:GntR family transcriptional regulator [Variovorax terrae]|uniref:GntR family transcriptional regulator n=1 Tax=Variovorax terrae TaxID=2923278 RepID=A0A9X1VW93_9BURK|nr:GntR family transcriptional regulator [Variovorax terrae]MCJ0764130.1 GntR family transcriptional regulator [Variovorax terrae]
MARTPRETAEYPEAAEPAAAGEPGAWASVADSVLGHLEEAILCGELKPGAKISEPEMAKRFGISRAPLREAIRRLEERKLVTHVPRQGARVIVLPPERVRQIFVIREAIEGMAAREAALRISEQDIQHLRDSLKRQSEQLNGPEPVGLPHVSFDIDYHAAIVRASGNEFLIRFLSEDYHALIELCRSRQRRRPERVQRSLQEHARIVDALADRDPELAEMMMRRHIAGARDDVLNHMPQP